MAGGLWLTVLACASLAGCDSSDRTARAGTAAASAGSGAPSSGVGPGHVASPSASAPAPAAVAAGERHYRKYCALCHGADAKGYAADNAPSLVSDTFLRSATDDFIAAGIAMGRPGTAMAPYGARFGGPLTDEDISQLVAFLRARGPAAETLTAVASGDADAGKPLFATLCASCHADGPQRSAPRLDLPVFLHHATDSFLDYAIRNGRPGTKMAPFADKLNATQIADIIAYVRTFQTPLPEAILAAPTGTEPMVVNPRGKQASFKPRDDRFVPAAQVAAALAAKRRMVILDARATSDWRLGHIPGAISMPYYEMKRIDEVPKDGTWVLAYCACPHHASGEVIDALRRLGYKNTAIIDEGITFWRQRGYPMALPPPVDGAKPSAAAPPAPRLPRPVAPRSAAPAPAALPKRTP